MRPPQDLLDAPAVRLLDVLVGDQAEHRHGGYLPRGPRRHHHHYHTVITSDSPLSFARMHCAKTTRILRDRWWVAGLICATLPSIRSYADKTLDLAGWCVTTVWFPASHQGLGVEHRGQGEDRRGEHERQPREHLEPVRLGLERERQTDRQTDRHR